MGVGVGVDEGWIRGWEGSFGGVTQRDINVPMVGNNNPRAIISTLLPTQICPAAPPEGQNQCHLNMEGLAGAGHPLRRSPSEGSIPRTPPVPTDRQTKTVSVGGQDGGGESVGTALSIRLF